jgi:hypothetical protein
VLTFLIELCKYHFVCFSAFFIEFCLFNFAIGSCVWCYIFYGPERSVRLRIPLMANVLNLNYVFKINFIIVNMQILRDTDCSEIYKYDLD